MPDYRRNRVLGTYFFTVTLLDRRSDLLIARIGALREAVRHARAKRPFHIDAWVILPEHRHCLWTLLDGDADFVGRWWAIKTAFSTSVPGGEARSAVRARRGETGHLAATVLGAHDPRRSRLRRAHGLCPFQPGQARLGAHGGSVAIFDFCPMRGTRFVFARLGWGRQRVGGGGSAGRCISGGIRFAFPPYACYAC